jgi:diguanylate cyclase (GGDEF)-like protein
MMALARLRNCRIHTGAFTVWLLLVSMTLAHATGTSWVPAETGRLTIEPAPPGHLPWIEFDERSGLPQNTILDLLADQRGFVWAATQDGAARYNGHNWETVPFPRRMGSNYARVMRNAKDGGIWFGSFDGGLAHLKDGVWKVYDTSSGLPSNRIRGLLETTDAKGTVLWIATDQGVARMQDGRIKVFGEASGLPSLDTEALCETTESHSGHSLLVGTSNGLARLVGDRFVPVPVPKALLGHRIDDMVESPGLNGDPALWIASYGAGMAVFERGKWTLLDTTSGLPSNVEVFTKSRADDGSPALWIGTEGGLLRFEHGRFTLYDERSGLPIRIIWKVLETTSPGGLKTLWLGTWGGGVVRLSPNVWRSFNDKTGMPSGAVTSVLLSKDDNGAEVIWAGTSDGGLARLSGDRFEAVPLPEAFRHAIIFSLLETRAADGTRSLWVASFAGGIGRLENGHWTVLDPNALPNQRVYQLIETKADDGSSVIWAGTDGGLGRFEHGQWTYYRKGAELPNENVTQVLQTTGADGARTIWVGTGKGIARLESGRWSVIGKAQGLASEDISSLQVTTDPDGVRWLWAGTFSGGASRLRLDDPAGRWETLSTRTSPALPSDTVQSVAEDHTGRVYLCTTRGVARLTLRKATPNNPEHFSEELFTTDDGLPSSDCEQGARLTDEHGRIWFGTARGLAMFDPRTERPDRTPKPLLIEKAELSDGSVVLHGGEKLSYTQRNITFSGALLAYGGESRIRYRYQLAGFDPHPSDWLASGVKEYTNLGAGKYKFLLWGKDAHGNVSGPVSLAFAVKPAPWLTAWAFLAYAVLIVLAAYGAMQLRVRTLAIRTQHLETEVAARTRDLVVARDELQRLATEDALTGVANRRKFDTTLDQEWRRAQRDGHWLTLVLLDVDFFKRYNDHYGHAGGDDCLRAVAQTVAAQCARPMDFVARYGGEEFALVLPDIEPDGVRTMLRSILFAVDTLQIEHADSACARYVTISLGAVSVKPGRYDEPQAALRFTDELLYKAKEGGRHQAIHADDETGATVTIDS